MRTTLMMLLALTTVPLGSAWGQALDRTPEEAALAKAIKRAERAGFEKHDKKKFLAVFAPDAKISFGRAQKPGDYDYSLTAEGLAGLAAHRFARGLTGKETVYFNDESARVKGDTGTFSAVRERHFFGGVEAFNIHYTAKKMEDGWRVTALRVWPVRQMIGGEPRNYDEQGYKEMDQQVEDAKTIDFRAHFTALVNARRYLEARALAEAHTAKSPTDAHGWAALSNVLIEFGEIEAAKGAADKARKIEPTASTPFHQ